MAQEATSCNGSKTPLRVFVFDNMRVRSHIFSRLFSQHPDLEQIYHPYLLPSFCGPERMTHHSKNSDARKKEVDVDWQPLYCLDTYGSCQRTLELEIAEIEKKGKSVWISEHSAVTLRQDIMLAANRGHKYTPEDLGPNPTYLPDWLFHSCTPVMVIRHPAKVVTSWWDGISKLSVTLPTDEDFHICTSQHYCRLLFDLFASVGKRPIVVEGDDVVWRTKEMTTNVCNGLGIDPEGAKDKWDPTPEEKRPKHPIIAAFTKTIHESHGVERPDKEPDGPIVTEKETAKFKDRYGEELGGQLKAVVEEHMPDYEYLRQFVV